MYTNSTATMFTETTAGYIPTFLGRVFIDHEKRKNLLLTGLTSIDSVFVMIPSVDIPITANGKNFIVKGEFTENVIGNTATELSNNLKAFKQANETYIISTVDRKISGSKRVQHTEVGCK